MLKALLLAALCAWTIAAAPAAAPEVLHERQSQGLHARMKAKGRYFGTFSDNRYLGDQPYVNILKNTDEFISITPGNSMKWDTTEPSKGSFNFEQVDGIVNFAKANKQRIRGHTLVWHSQLPQWVKNINSASELRSVMTNHITTVMKRWYGQNVVIEWDVVNEPFEDNGQYRNSIFYQLLGKDYIAESFRIARSVNPNAELYLNEYNNDNGVKADAFYTLARELKNAGLIDGVGIQGHYILGGIPGGLQTRMKALSDLGLDVSITELDIRIPNPTTAAKLTQQANDFAIVTKACMAVPRCVGITVASFTDKYSWIPGTFPGYDNGHQWDKNLAKKPAYTSTLNAI